MDASSSSAPASWWEETLPKAPTQSQQFEVDSPLQSSCWSARISSQIAPRLSRRATRAITYLRGPRPKVDLPAFVPILDFRLQNRIGTLNLPLETTLTRITKPFTHPGLLLLLGVTYIIGLAFFSRAQSFLTPPTSWLRCTSAFWLANEKCGLNGQDCIPFFSPSYDFRCPAQCKSVILENPRTVGNERVVFEPLIVGGGDANGTYRGDSFICAAANHAGLITNSKGGCFSVQVLGNFTSYLPKTANGLKSLGFPGVFPLSFRMSATTSLTGCTDLRNFGLVFNILITGLLFFVFRPPPLVLYYCLVSIGFWHVSLFSQTRANPPALDIAFGAFLPTLFVAYGLWRVAFRFTLPTFAKAPIEAGIWYIGPFWVGILANVTTNIPIDRLLASDLRERAGAITALVVIVIFLLLIAINQLRVIRKTGWLPWYIGWYTLAGMIILVLSQLPGLRLRLHHYIIAIFFIPGTGFPTRLSAIYQGFLLGLFLNGVAAFGYDSIVQTDAALLRDAAQGSVLPSFLTNSATYNSSIPFLQQTISWAVLPRGQDGFALLVDDVERYFGTALNFSLASLNASLPHFFRIAYMKDGLASDFTMPAVLWPNGTWVDPLPGPS